jgi:hypothetical protein
MTLATAAHRAQGQVTCDPGQLRLLAREERPVGESRR